MLRRKYVQTLVALILMCGGAFHAAADSITGKISDGSGASISNAEIIAREVQSSNSVSVLSATDGSYQLDSLPAGTYTIHVRKPGFAELVREGVATAGNGPDVRLNLQLRSAAEQSNSQTAEELNPNVFVVKLDTNGLTRELEKRGPEVAYIREFRVDDNYFGAEYSSPLRSVRPVRPSTVVSGFHASIYEFHQNNHFNARPFFAVGSLQPARFNQFGAAATLPVIHDKLSVDAAWSSTRDSGMVNGNVQVPLASERTPRSTNPAVNAVIGRLLQAFPTALPNQPSVAARQLNTNAFRDVSSTALSTRVDYRLNDANRIAVEQRFLDSTEKPFEMVVGQNPQTLLRPQSVHVTEQHTFSPSTVGAWPSTSIGCSFRST